MSNGKNEKHLGYDLLCLALFLVGGFLAFSTIMSFTGNGVPKNATTQLIVDLHGIMGAVPVLLVCLVGVAMGAFAFMQKEPINLTLPGGLAFALFIASSLVLGAFSETAGGSFGAFLPGAIGGVFGALAGVVLGLVVLVGAGWLALGMPSLPSAAPKAAAGKVAGKSEKDGEFGTIRAALKEDSADGVTMAEAAALIPDEPPSLAAAPGVREFEMRMRGELPEGVMPLGGDDDHGTTETQGYLQVEEGPDGASAASGTEGPAGADLAAAEAGAGGLVEGHWVRPLEDEDDFDDEDLDEEVDAELDEAAELEEELEDEGELTDAPVTPSWEASVFGEDDEEEDEDDVFANVEVDVALELDEEEDEELEDDEEVAAELEEDEEDDEDVAAELDDEELEEEGEELEDDEDVAAELEEDEEDDEDVAAELDDEELEEEDEELEDDEEVAAELEEDEEDDEDVAAELDDEELEEEDEELEDDEDVAAELEEDEEDDEDVAAELDDEELEEEDEELEDDEDVAAELEEDEEDDEDVAAELDDEELEEDDEELEDDEEVAAELEEDEDVDEDVAAELEEGALADVFSGEDVDEDPEEVAEVADEASAPPFKKVAQPGLFDEDEAPLFPEPAAEEMTPVVAETPSEDAPAEPESKPASKPKSKSKGKSKKAAAPEPTPVAAELDDTAADLEARGQASAEAAEEAETAEVVELAEVELEPAPKPAQTEAPEPVASEESPAERDVAAQIDDSSLELLYRAGLLFLSEGRVAVSMLQRRFEMSFKEATTVLDDLQELGLIGPYIDGKRRDFLLTLEEWEELNLTP